MVTPPLRPSVHGSDLADVAARVGGVLRLDNEEVPPGSSCGVLARGITHDSREVQPGDVYVALRGQRFDGAAFTADAVAAGAVAVLTDSLGARPAHRLGAPTIVVDDVRRAMGPAAAQIYGDPGRRLSVLGITGTNGKTTTSFLLEAAARAAGRTTGLIGTIATFIGSERLDAVRTTPEATDLHRLLAVMLERGVDTVVMEVSSHALVMGRVGGVMFDVMGFTNLSQDHLDFHGSMEAYFEAKALAFTRERTRNAVIMRDDPAGTPWAEKMSRRSAVPTVTVSRAGTKTGGAGARYIPVEPPRESTSSQCAQVAIGGEPVVVCTQLTGSWNLSNAVLAAVMAARAGIGWAEAAQGISALASVPGRLEPVNAEASDVQGFVDYAHTPEAVHRVVSEIRTLVAADRHLTVVIGCGGDRDATKRALMGQAAAAFSDLVVVTDDNPRSEDPAVIRAAVISGAGTQSAEVVEQGDRAQAIAAAVQRTHQAGGGVVLVLGKGHEVGQEIAGQIVDFDDRLVLAEALRTVSSVQVSRPS